MAHMNTTEAGQLRGTNTLFELECLPDHVTRAITDNGGSKDAVGAALDVDLDETLGLSLQDSAVVVVKL